MRAATARYGRRFYDASLASRSHRAQWRRPVLIGLAHEFQKVDALNVDSWDVPLDGILTDKPSGRLTGRRCALSEP